jgi:hypothetical protein
MQDNSFYHPAGLIFHPCCLARIRLIFSDLDISGSFLLRLWLIPLDIQNQVQKVTGYFALFGHLQNECSKKVSTLKMQIVVYSYLPTFVSDSDLVLCFDFNNLPQPVLFHMCLSLVATGSMVVVGIFINWGHHFFSRFVNESIFVTKFYRSITAN